MVLLWYERMARINAQRLPSTQPGSQGLCLSSRRKTTTKEAGKRDPGNEVTIYRNQNHLGS